MSAIKRSTEILGGQTPLAKLLGVSQSHVWNWINRKHQAPARYIRAISKATGGKVSVKELLSDHEENTTE
ncbi:helix-turn-helix domain-containing protein [Vibrio sp. 10N.261.55.A7]|uniref:helix-turn-helix domain-containing protein n=1 Tax=Vibrio sp. 10N.261.55.A7 TaxID=1880851 RepID=UPI000C8513F6|nr:helix-turn-helix domain-containing protein [Vibrio sp. 10N.261.55.A7]PMK03335.1 antirepressor [Vibrio sp. 10N.261.55.A7]